MNFAPNVVHPDVDFVFLLAGGVSARDQPGPLAAANYPQLSSDAKVSEWMEMEEGSISEDSEDSSSTDSDVAGPDPDLSDPPAAEMTIASDGNKINRVSGGAPVTSEALDVDQCDTSP